MKRLQIVILLMKIMFLTGIGHGQNLTVTIPNINASAGKEVFLDIHTTDLTGLQVFSVDFSLAYDANILQAMDVTSAGTISSPWGNPTVNLSSGTVVISLAGIDPLSGSGTLLRIRFHVSATAVTGETSQLMFINFKFNDGQPTAKLENGSFTVIGDTSPPTIISGPSVVGRNYFDVTVSFTTDEPSRVLLLYGETTFYGQGASDPTLSKSHILNLSNLNETTAYYYQIQLTDSLNNGPAIFSGFTFRSKDVTLTLPNLTVDPGTEVTIPVTVPDMSALNVTNLSLDILFQDSQLQVLGINRTNTILSNWPEPQISISADKLSLQAAHSIPLQGENVLFYIHGKI
ncbi:MAG: cohesin domain-containing protein, partial [bacterium]|nr:cohesin domain-containing protein [bacterium]